MKYDTHNISYLSSISWIVTLDVLKFEVADVERLRRYGWIVTLDVLKWWSGNFLSLFLRVE